MLENWLKKARGSATGQSLIPLRWKLLFPSGIWIGIAVITLIGVRLLWVNAGHPAHQEEITAAFGSASLFRDESQINHAGSQFTYVATQEKGYGLFLCDMATGHKQIICEEVAASRWNMLDDLRALPWSPDDKAFIYTSHNKLVLQLAEANTPAVQFDIGTNMVSSVVWLTPTKFAWLEGETLCLASKSAAEEWQLRKLPHQGQVLSLTAIDDHTIAWLHQDSIWELDLLDMPTNANAASSKKPLAWLDPKVKGLTGFSYSGETSRFLLCRTNNGVDSLWLLDAKADSETHASQIMQGRFLRDAQWAGNGEFVYTSHNPNRPGLVLADLSGNERARLFDHGHISWWFKMVSDCRQLLYCGTISNEPVAGIWHYNLDSGQLQSVVPGADQFSAYAKYVAPFHGSIKLASGRSVKYTVYAPANFDRNKKYPLLLGHTFLTSVYHRIQGPAWAPCVAACGAFFINIDRFYYSDSLDDRWAADVIDVYQRLIQDPSIDGHQVYLLGVSGEAKYLSECLIKSPELWKGAILLSPTDLPEFPKQTIFQARPKILISIGDGESLVSQLKAYQANALKFGVNVDVTTHSGEWDNLTGNLAQLERAKAIMHFIFEK